MFAVAWIDAEHVSEVVSAGFAGCALLVSVISLYFSLRSGPVRVIIGGADARGYLCSCRFKIPVVFYNGTTTAVVIRYSVSLESQASALRIPGLGHEATLLVAPRSYELANLDCAADSVASPKLENICVKWTYLRRGREKGPCVTKWKVRILPPETEVLSDEGHR